VVLELRGSSGSLAVVLKLRGTSGSLAVVLELRAGSAGLAVGLEAWRSTPEASRTEPEAWQPEKSALVRGVRSPTAGRADRAVADQSAGVLGNPSNSAGSASSLAVREALRLVREALGDGVRACSGAREALRTARKAPGEDRSGIAAILVGTMSDLSDTATNSVPL
jgi:hypothetical protein